MISVFHSAVVSASLLSTIACRHGHTSAAVGIVVIVMFRLQDKVAARTVARALAHRCKETGITEMIIDPLIEDTYHGNPEVLYVNTLLYERHD